MKLYELVVNHELMNTYECFEKCFYEFLKIIIHIKNRKCVRMNVISNEMIVDELCFDDLQNHLSIYSKYKNIFYDIQTKEEVFDFVYLYTAEKIVSSEILFSLMFLINKITLDTTNCLSFDLTKNKKTNEKPENKKTIEKKENRKPENKKDNIKLNTFDKLEELEAKLLSKQLITNDDEVMSKPTIEKVSYLEKHDDDATDTTDTSDTSNTSDNTDSLSEFSEFCNENMEIYELEKTKEKIKNIISNVEKSIDKEDFDLAVYAGEIDKVRILEEKEKQKMEDKINQFNSQKNFTYKTIYNDFFNKKIIPSWDDIPTLFSANFAIFLYLDGKDCNGNNVRPRILDTDDEYRIYNLLLLALTDDTFELPDLESDRLIITDFLDTLPPITLLSSDNIMKSLNDPENDLFENDATSLNSVEDVEDAKNGNNTYN